MAFVQSRPNLSSCHQSLTPPDSSTMGSVMPHATMEYLLHIFDVLAKVLSDLTNREPPNTPVAQDQFSPGPDVVQLKQLLERVPSELSQETELSQSCVPSNEQAEKFQVADGLDLESPTCTTPDDFKRFEKWASKSQLKIALETYEPLPPLPFSLRRLSIMGVAGTRKHVNTRLLNRQRPTVVQTTC